MDRILSTLGTFLAGVSYSMVRFCCDLSKLLLMEEVVDTISAVSVPIFLL